MSKAIASMFLALIITTQLEADDPSGEGQGLASEWLDYYEGSWKWEATHNGQRGKTTFRQPSDDVKALYIHTQVDKDTDKGTVVGMIGWDAHKEKLVEITFDSDGSCGTVIYTAISRNTTHGKLEGRTKTGEAFSGSFRIKRISDREFEKHVQGAVIGDSRLEDFIVRFSREP